MPNTHSLIPNSWKYKIEVGGYPYLVSILVSKILGVVYNRVCMVVYSLTDIDINLDDISQQKLKLTFKKVPKGEYPPGYIKARYYQKALDSRCDSGGECHAFFLGEELCHVAWVCRDRLMLSRDFGEITEESMVGIFDCWTVTKFRSMGVYKSVIKYLLNKYRLLGYQKFCIAVTADNYPSIKAIENVGFNRYMDLNMIRIIGIRIYDSRIEVRKN